jgi:hypothetical protein
VNAVADAAGWGVTLANGNQLTPLPANGSHRGGVPLSHTSDPGPRPRTKKVMPTASTVASAADPSRVRRRPKTLSLKLAD